MKLWFYGLADCHGVESFVHEVSPVARELFFAPEDSENVSAGQYAMCLRAHANPQRHAVAYRVKMEEEDSNKVQEMLKNTQYVEALNYIKEHAIELQLGTQYTTKKAAEKNWKMIPNPDLDPYHDGEDES